MPRAGSLASRGVVGLSAALLFALTSIAGAPSWGQAPLEGDDIRAAEQLVRSEPFEGIPADRARALSDAAVAALAAMLDDMDEARHHARILEVLGLRRGSIAFRAVLRYAAHEPLGEVDAAAYRAQVALRLAMGRLAGREDGALAYLLLHARPERPAWSCGHLRGDRLGRLLDEMVWTGLGLSGRPEAEAALRGLLQQLRGASTLASRATGSEPERRARRQLERALAVHARVAAGRRVPASSMGRTP